MMMMTMILIMIYYDDDDSDDDDRFIHIELQHIDYKNYFPHKNAYKPGIHIYLTF
jgi:hypothetical protein